MGDRPRRVLAALGDSGLAVLIALASLPAWAPHIGLAAARETMAARRARRAAEAETAQIYGLVWARQARRNALESARQC